ncbi:sulfite exporter TauE/SafE family protein [Frankia sp. AgB1.8]|uniref:sulfite exporter TauE/SafE family protein n=1 Tax=Frankia sp. AgB1.8 TaxID=2792839 RepID=UPI00210639FF|nr:sulfite exporter TauE/SafE family protein [Frankia sp. AgB1.8]
MFGVGGGFVVIPALVVLLGLPMPTAVGTSLAIIVINSGAGFVARAGDTELDYRVTGAFTAAAVIGSLAAGRVATGLPAQRLSRAFAYVVLGVAVFVAAQAVLNPPASGGPG